MHKQHSSEPTVFAGIDVGACELTVAVEAGEQSHRIRSFANTVAGHQQLRRYLHDQGQRTHVCLEASGNYSLDVCLALQDDKRIELSVINRAWRDVL